MEGSVRGAGALLAAALLGLGLVIAPAVRAEQNPTVTGPISGGLHGRPWMGAPFDVGGYGYSEEEYFYSGTAKAYGADQPRAHL